jgi:hypothetical protein
VSGVVQRRVQLGWAAPKVLPTRSRLGRLAGVLGVERRALETVLAAAHHDLERLRRLTLGELRALGLPARDAERIFYLVQWERLHAHLELHGELLERPELAPLLETLAPIFERHFDHNDRLNDALLALYRAELLDHGATPVTTRSPGGHAPRGWRRLCGFFGL